MGELFISILVILGAVIFIGLILIGVSRKKKQKDAAISQLALQRGWRYQKIQSARQEGYTLQGNGWIFESVASSTSVPFESGASSVAYSNRWFSQERNSTEGMVLIGPRLPSIQLGGLGDFVLQQAIKVMLGEESSEAEGLAEIEIGRATLREKYSIWAPSDEAARNLISFGIENALLNWKLREIPVIKVSSKGTEIKLKQGRINDPDEILAVTQLGEAFLRG